MPLTTPIPLAWASAVLSLLPPVHRSMLQVAAQPVQWHFDALRAQYSAAVQAGLLQRSLIAAGRFNHGLDQLERLTLGPLARSV